MRFTRNRGNFCAYEPRTFGEWQKEQARIKQDEAASTTPAPATPEQVRAELGPTDTEHSADAL